MSKIMVAFVATSIWCLISSLGLNVDGAVNQVLDGIDVNKDGRLSYYEVVDNLGEEFAAAFRSADADKDMHLSGTELNSLLSRATKEQIETLVENSEVSIAESIMTGLDTDKDSKLSMNELLNHIGEGTMLQKSNQGWQQGFKSADKDKDGYLTVKELASLLNGVERDDQQKLVEGSELEVAASIMDGFDSDRNGKITMRELMDHISDNQELHASFKGWQDGFTQADANKDGQLSLPELAMLLRRVSMQDQQKLVEESEDEVAVSVMNGFDSDRNGKISMRELLDHVGNNKDVQAAFQGWQQGFMEADADRDGQLSVKELSSLLHRVSRKDSQKLVEDSELDIAQSIIDGFDVNRNGKLSLRELLDHIGTNQELLAAFQGWRQGFTEVDADKDGELSVGELSSLLQRVSRGDQQKLVEGSELEVAASIMDGFDSDRNGKITMRELLDHISDNQELHASFKGWQDGFTQADANKDGQLSLPELAMLLRRVSRQDQQKLVEESEDEVAVSVMNGFDSDRNGKISMRELLDHVGDNKEVQAAFQGWQQGFMEADADKDGQLSVKELSSLLHRVSRKHQQELVADSTHEVAESVMDGFDSNRNGKLSMRELHDRVGDSNQAAFQGWERGFLNADADQDGELSVEELSSLLHSVSSKDQQELVDESVIEVAASVLNGFDTDRNQQISLRELLDRVGADGTTNSAFQGWKQGFVEADKDENGQLDLHELASLLERVSRKDQHNLLEQSEDEVAASVMYGFDSDRNGKISLRELVNRIGDNKEVHAAFKGWPQGFAEADVDKDGELDSQELSSLLQRVSRKDQQDLVQDSELSVAATVLDGIDADRDGRLSFFELLDHAEKTGIGGETWTEGFKNADANKDMFLNIEELASLFKIVSRQSQHELVEESEASKAASLLENIDTDGDGKITFQEMRAHLPPSVKTWSQGFYDADTDQDGMLNLGELITIVKSLTRPEQQQVGFDAVSQTGKVLQGFDANRDGKLSFEEIAKHAGMFRESYGLGNWKEGFVENDIDGDGHLNFQELHDLLDRMSAKSQKREEI